LPFISPFYYYYYLFFLTQDISPKISKITKKASSYRNH